MERRSEESVAAQTSSAKFLSLNNTIRSFMPFSMSVLITIVLALGTACRDSDCAFVLLHVINDDGRKRRTMDRVLLACAVFCSVGYAVYETLDVNFSKKAAVLM